MVLLRVGVCHGKSEAKHVGIKEDEALVGGQRGTFRRAARMSRRDVGLAVGVLQIEVNSIVADEVADALKFRGNGSTEHLHQPVGVAGVGPQTLGHNKSVGISRQEIL